ncbi:MAG: hypothetical protein M3R63_00985 [Actinomycetota bacterium]|nr:hypothetical protein [Actinomycetota bacterium]
MRNVRTATAADGDAVSAVLAGAFADDPVFTWMIPDPARRSQLLPAFFALFTEAFVPLGVSEVVDGRDAITGAALWAPPGQQAIRDEDAEEFAGRIEHIAGADTGRIFEVVSLLEEQHPQAD